MEFKPIKFDKRMLIAIVAVSILIPGIYYFFASMGAQMKRYDAEIISGLLFTFVVTLSISWVNLNIINYIHRKIPDIRKWSKRLGIELAISSVTAALIISFWVMMMYIFYLASPMHGDLAPRLVYSQNILVALIVNTIFVLGFEANYLVRQWRESLIETEKLRRISAESQFSALKNQVNPHFLFNSLNVLSHLIATDPGKAQEFIGRFSWIYRYVLQVRDKSMVSLREEEEFLSSYLFLQTLRFEKNLELRIDIPEEIRDHFLPPLSLQLIIENALKHNEISSSRPMKIDVFAENASLVIRNTYQPRKEKEESTGFGIEHLKLRYSYISDEKPEFYVQNNLYIAKIPLISPAG
jgi:sensor histidine kinase YesM